MSKIESLAMSGNDAVGTAKVDPPDPASAREHYIGVARQLLDDARERDAIQDLVDVLTYTLARIVVSFDPRVAGHVLQQMGGHIISLTESMQAERKAQREMEELKEQGRSTH